MITEIDDYLPQESLEDDPDYLAIDGFTAVDSLTVSFDIEYEQ